LSPPINTAYGAFLFRTRQYDEAIRQLQYTIKEFSNYTVALPELAEVYGQQGRWEDAIRAYRRTIELGGSHPHVLAGLGYILARSGKTDEARHIVIELEAGLGDKHHSPTRIGYVYRGMKEYDKVFYWFSQARSYGDAAIVTLKVDPANDPLRSDPRYVQLIEELKL
jgi:hypothetical protein